MASEVLARCRHCDLSSLSRAHSQRRPLTSAHRISCGVLDTIRQNLEGLGGGSKSASETRLLQAIQGTRQGLETSAAQKADILAAVEDLVEAGAGVATASSSSINATWKLLWTTEKVQICALSFVHRILGPPFPSTSSRVILDSYKNISERCRSMMVHEAHAGDPLHPQAGKMVWDGGGGCLPGGG